MRDHLAARVTVIERELATLLVFTALRGPRAGGVLVINGNAAVHSTDPTADDPHRQVALDALVELT